MSLKKLAHVKEKHAIYYEGLLRRIDHLYQSLDTIQQASETYQSEQAQINQGFLWANAAFKTNSKASLLYSDYASSEAFVSKQHPQFIIQRFGVAAQVAKIYGQMGIYCQHLISIGNAHADMGELDQSLLYYNQALQQAEQEGNASVQGLAWALIGNVEGYRTDYSLAIEALERALYFQEENTRDRGITLTYLANIYRDMGDYEKAISVYKVALISQQDVRVKANTLDNLGAVYSDIGYYDQALMYHQQALTILEQLDNPSRIAQTYVMIAIVHMNRGLFETAKQFLEKALQICQSIYTTTVEGSVLNHLAALYIYWEKYHIAEHLLEEALGLAQQTQDQRLAANIVGNLGLVASGQDNLEGAIHHHRQALNQHRRSHDRRGYGKDLNHLGQAYFAKGDFRRALACYRAAAKVHRTLHRRMDEAEALGNMVPVLLETNKLQVALDTGKTALAILQEIGAEQVAGKTLQNLGVVAAFMGNHIQAVDYFEQATDNFTRIGDQISLKDALYNLAGTLDELEMYEQAMNIYRRLHALGELELSVEAEVIASMAVIEHRFENYDTAMKLYHQAKTLFAKDQNAEMIAWADLNIQRVEAEK